MRQQLLRGVLGITLFTAAAAPAAAANKEHQQLAADIRMLQEQAQVLQNLLGQLNESLKAVNSRLDQHGETNRKAFADQKLAVDNLSNDVRVIREKLDDNNVRLGSLSQEVEALRQSLQQFGSRSTATTTEPDAGAGATAGAPSGAPGQTPLVGASPTKMWEAAFADYTAGQYDLAILGFEAYIKSFPKSDMADDAQVYICAAYLQDNKNDKAIEACDVAIRNYPGGNAICEAYFRKGLAQSNLRNVDAARATWEALVKTYPDCNYATMATQKLEQMKKPD